MTPQFQQHASHTEIKNASRIIPALVGGALLMGLFAPAALASWTDCQAVGLSRSGAIASITGWKDLSVPLTFTVQRDLMPALFLEAAPLLRSTRFNHGMGSGNPCWGQSSRRNTVVSQALVRSVGKSSTRSLTQAMRILALPYNGKKQVLQARTILPEIIITPRDRISSIIGPVQENVTHDQSHMAGLNQVMATRPTPGESHSLAEGRPILATDALKADFRLPVNESLRMNMTTMQAIHGGNCASGCP